MFLPALENVTAAATTSYWANEAEHALKNLTISYGELRQEDAQMFAFFIIIITLQNCK